MAKIPPVNLNSSINTFRTSFNKLVDSVGDLATLTTDTDSDIVKAINSIDSNQGTRSSLSTSNKTNLVAAINEHSAELGTISSGAMGTTASTVGGAIAELDARLDSINDTQLNTQAVYVGTGGVSADGALSTDNDLIVRRNSFIGNDNPLIPTSIYMYSKFARALLPVNDAQTGKNLGDSNLRWKHVFTENVIADSSTIGDLNVTGTLMSGTLTVDSAHIQSMIDSNFNDSNEIATIANRSITNNKILNNTITINGVTFALGESKVIDTTDSGVQIALIRKVMRADSDTGIHYDSAGLEFSLSSVPNTSLANSSIVINGTTFNLGDDSSIVITNAQLENSTFSVNGNSGSLGSDVTVDVTDSAAIQSLLDSNLGDLDVSAITKGKLGPLAGTSSDNLQINAGGLLNLRSAYSTTGGNIRMYHQYNYADSEMFNFYGTGNISTVLSAFRPMKFQTVGASDGITLDAGHHIYLDAAQDIYLQRNGTNVVHFDMVTTGINQLKFLNSGRTDISTPTGEDLKLDCENLIIDLDAQSDYVDYNVNGTQIVTFQPLDGDSNSTWTANNFKISCLNDGIFTAQDLQLTGNNDVNITSGNDIRLKAGSGNSIYMDDISSSDRLTFSFDGSIQNITSSDNMVLKSPAVSGYYVELNGAKNILNPRVNSTIELQDNGTQRGYFLLDSADTVKLYTGSSTLNSTFANDDLTVQGDITSISDERTKENIETITTGLDIVDSLRGVYYNKIGEDERRVGVIAQEVEQVLPEVVKTDTQGMKSVDYGKMVGVLIEAIKDLKTELDQLKNGG